VLSGFGRDTPRKQISDKIVELLKETSVEQEGIFVPGKMASIGVVRFSTASDCDMFFKKVVADDTHPEFEGRRLYWNPARTPEERTASRLLSKVKKYLITHNVVNGVEVFKADDITTQSKKKNGLVWIKRDRVAEIKHENVIPSEALSNKYGLKGEDLLVFIAAESECF